MELLCWDLKDPKPVEDLPFGQRSLDDDGFASTFSCLGVRIILGESQSGLVQVGNRESRIKELTAAAFQVQQAKRLSPALARSLAGRLQFASQQVFGRCAAALLRYLHRQGTARSDVLIDPELPRVLADLSTILISNPKP